MSEKCVRNHVCHTQDAQLRELRRELAESQAVEETLRAYIQHLEDRHREDLVCMGEMSDPTYEELRQRAEQAEASMSVLVGWLQASVEYANCELCRKLSPTGCAGDNCSIQHAKLQLANLPALATERLERERRRDEALAWYEDEDNYAGVGHNDYVARSRIGWDGGLRAREALREEVKQGDKTGL